MEERATVAVVLRTRVRAAIRTRNGRLWTNFPPVLLEADQATLMRRPVRGGSADSGNRARSSNGRARRISCLPLVSVHGCDAWPLCRGLGRLSVRLLNAFSLVERAFWCRSRSREVYANPVTCQFKMSPFFR